MVTTFTLWTNRLVLLSVDKQGVESRRLRKGNAGCGLLLLQDVDFRSGGETGGLWLPLAPAAVASGT